MNSTLISSKEDNNGTKDIYDITSIRRRNEE